MPPPPQGPVQMAVGPGLLCKAGSPKAGQQRNNKMDSLLLKTRKLATSHGCQSLQPIEGRQHQAAYSLFRVCWNSAIARVAATNHMERKENSQPKHLSQA
ncbi:uncharacterized protein LOC135320871 isoform X4 [Camelus dromedarius]|uniref:Uncharacterized protein LOC141577079 isoform X5 n=1 Tax=Camelus bactrianus TaxID=9837 RepID=A0AC58Q380_CAMBA